MHSRATVAGRFSKNTASCVAGSRETIVLILGLESRPRSLLNIEIVERVAIQTRKCHCRPQHEQILRASRVAFAISSANGRFFHGLRDCDCEYYRHWRLHQSWISSRRHPFGFCFADALDCRWTRRALRRALLPLASGRPLALRRALTFPLP